MNRSLVKSVPPGDFPEVSALKKGWQKEMELLISQKRPFKFDMYPLPGIPPEVSSQLDQQGYNDLVLKNDQWQHFLVSHPEWPGGRPPQAAPLAG